MRNVPLDYELRRSTCLLWRGVCRVEAEGAGPTLATLAVLRHDGAIRMACFRYSIPGARFQPALWPLIGALVVGCVPDRPANDAGGSELSATDLAEAPPVAPAAESAAPAVGQAAPPPSGISWLDQAVAQSPGVTTPGPQAASGPVLSRTALIRAVIARNPEADARRHALRAARARRSQVSALDDPEVAYSFAPMSIGGSTFGQIIQVSQRFPWPGKRASLGDSADFEADAAREDVRVTELDLALEASLLFDDYCLVYHSLDVNEHHRHLLIELKSSAEIQLSVGRGSFQDPLQAEVEISRLAEQDVVLRSERNTIVSSLNALLHRGPNEALPPPPQSSSVALDLPPPEEALVRAALQASPELRGLRARERAAESVARYSKREYYPDFTLMASYSTMFMPDSRFMVGASTPIPLQRGRRAGALDEANARIAETRSERARALDRLRAEVSIARRRVVESIEVVKLFDGRLLPTARAQVNAASVDFLPGRTSFLAVVEGEKNLREVELSRYSTIAELGRRRAKLDRALGRVPFSAKTSGAR